MPVFCFIYASCPLVLQLLCIIKKSRINIAEPFTVPIVIIFKPGSEEASILIIPIACDLTALVNRLIESFPESFRESGNVSFLKRIFCSNRIFLEASDINQK